VGRLIFLVLAACGRVAFDPIGEGGGDDGMTIDGSNAACNANPSCRDHVTVSIDGI
jgi:hypothetical protein